MIHLSVSIGEAIDKLSILDIKCKRITDPDKHVHCQREYELLHKELHPYIEKYPFYYKQLYTINDDIWIMQDEIRVHPDPQKCVDILDKNDMRFRIKDNINQVKQILSKEILNNRKNIKNSDINGVELIQKSEIIREECLYNNFNKSLKDIYNNMTTFTTFQQQQQNFREVGW
jgi:hypothetical protein